MADPSLSVEEMRDQIIANVNRAKNIKNRGAVTTAWIKNRAAVATTWIHYDVVVDEDPKTHYHHAYLINQRTEGEFYEAVLILQARPRPTPEKAIHQLLIESRLMLNDTIYAPVEEVIIRYRKARSSTQIDGGRKQRELGSRS
jgi:hypothetical protein